MNRPFPKFTDNLKLKVDYMRYADLVIVLGADGQVMEQGRPEDLRSYAAGVLELDPMETKQRNPEIHLIHDHETHDEPQESTVESLGDSSDSDKRQGGADLSIYKYYFSALGWQRICFLLLFWTIDSGMDGFRCEFPYQL